MTHKSGSTSKHHLYSTIYIEIRLRKGTRWSSQVLSFWMSIAANGRPPSPIPYQATELLEKTIPDTLRSLENRLSSVEQRVATASAEASSSAASLTRAVAAITVGARVPEHHEGRTRAEGSTKTTTKRSRFTGKRRRNNAKAEAYQVGESRSW